MLDDAARDALLADFESWCVRKKRDVDLLLLDDLLRLRSSYDDLAETYWPLGSVEHLLLERWPSKGAVEAPDPDVVVATLEAWVKFLRGTGRMAARSGDPRELTKEARRVAPAMAEAADDRSHWSSTKVILDHARSVGIDLDLAEDEEQLQQMLQQAQNAWNSLPVDERRRLMPDPSGSGRPRTGERPVSGMEETGLREGLPPVDGLVASFVHRLPERELATPEIVGPQFRDSDFVRQVGAFAAWVGDGKELTATEVLRMAPAKEAYDVLGLAEWDRQRALRDMPSGSAGTDDDVERWLDIVRARSWRSAADCEPLDRLWWGALSAGAIAIEGRRVIASGREPADATEWMIRGMACTAGLMERVDDGSSRMAVVLHVLLTSFVEQRRLVGASEVDDFYHWWLFGDRERSPYHRGGAGWALMGDVLDTAIVSVEPGGARITEAGEVFLAWWLQDRYGAEPRP